MLNLLLPHYQSEHGAGPLHPWFNQELDVSAAGPFFAPFWATFGYFNPAEIAGSPGSALVAPFFLWLYCLLVLILFVNLLIAMFNARYSEVVDASREHINMNKALSVAVFLLQHPIPAPFILLVLPIDFVMAWPRLRASWKRVAQARQEAQRLRQAAQQHAASGEKADGPRTGPSAAGSPER